MKVRGQGGDRKAGAGRDGSRRSLTGARRTRASAAGSRTPAGRTLTRPRPTKTAARTAQRTRSLRDLVSRRFLRAMLLAAGCLALGAGLGAGLKAAWSALCRSPLFAIREIVVRTGPRVPESEVRMLADVSVGDNLLAFRLAECVEAIEIHPWVKRASVMRELPDRVVIEVETREPAAMIALGALYYLDRDGEIFKKVLPGEDKEYPILTGLSLQEVVEAKEKADPLIREALELIALSGRSRLLPTSALSEVFLDRTYGATLVRAADAMRITFGHDAYPGKWARMERTLVELGDEAEKALELDLNYESRVTIRLREGYRVAAAAGPAEGL